MKEKKIFIISSIVVLAIVMFPFLYLKTNAYILVHDNLDGEFVHLHLLKMSGLLFSFSANTIVPNIMNGLPRSCFHSEFSFIRLLFLVIPSFWAYVINIGLIRIIGFTGMYLLTKDHLIKGGNIKILIGLAALFSIIPLYPIYGLSVMGQPLLLWCFLNLNKNPGKFINWLVILIFPFYSHFALIAPFILIALMGYGVYKLAAKDKTINKYYFIGIVLLFICFIAANFITIKCMLFPNGYISHRSVWLVKQGSFSCGSILKQFITTFLSGEDHSSSFIAVPIYLYTFIIFFLDKNKFRKKILLITPVILIGLISVLEAIYPVLRYFSQNFVKIFSMFQFNRFTFLIPLLWFIGLGIAIKYSKNKINPIILYLIIIFQLCFIVLKNYELKLNYAIISHISPTKVKKIQTFQSYFAADLFSDIDKFINKPKKNFRVISLGISPSIAQYNGFFTLDSYQSNYPLKYKNQFREIIENELNKNSTIRDYFDDWGSRCYLFSSELQKSCYFNCLKNGTVQLDSLSINTRVLKNMGGEYVFSAVPINNHKELQLTFVKAFYDDNSLWDIYLYKVD